jgi:hypothetical protein
MKKYLFLVLCLLLVNPVCAETLEESAAWCKMNSHSDAQFFEYVIQEVQAHIKCRDLPGLAVMSPDLAWERGYGDCSERALVMVKMLESQGYKADYVYGLWNKNLHARVRVTVSKWKKVYLDANDPRLKGDWEFHDVGLYPGEYLVSA